MKINFASREEARTAYAGRGAFRTWPPETLDAYLQDGLRDTEAGVDLERRGVVVGDLVDLDAERTRLAKEIKRVEGEIGEIRVDIRLRHGQRLRWRWEGAWRLLDSPRGLLGSSGAQTLQKGGAAIPAGDVSDELRVGEKVQCWPELLIDRLWAIEYICVVEGASGGVRRCQGWRRASATWQRPRRGRRAQRRPGC